MGIQHLSTADVKAVAAQLGAGQVVALPTDTVYGLAADATNEGAVDRIYQLKERSTAKALLILVDSLTMLAAYVDSVGVIEEALMARFWPGPLTLIFPLKSGSVAANVNQRKKTIAVRWPQDSFLQAVIGQLGRPIVAPSANRSGHLSLTQGQAVAKAYEGADLLVVDSELAEQKLNVESTIVQVQGEKIVILRAGAISRQDLQTLGYPVVDQSHATKLSIDGVDVYYYGFDQAIGDLLAFIDQHADQRIGFFLTPALRQSLAAATDYSRGIYQEYEEESVSQTFYWQIQYLVDRECDIIILQGLESTDSQQAVQQKILALASQSI